MVLTRGTIVETGRGLYYSEYCWHSPVDGVRAQPGVWRRISWGDVENLPGDAMPRSAGEFILVADFVE